MEQKRPLLIGITSRMTTVYEDEAIYCCRQYIRYLNAADPSALPVVLPVVDEAGAAAYARLCDGLLINGGEDMDPALYGEAMNGTGALYPQDYDQSDLFLYHAFRKLDKPVFGICRGIQAINIAEGGTLIQDIPSFNGSQHNQRKLDPPAGQYATAHTVNTAEGTLLAQLVGSQCEVNSFHHQAVKEVGSGLTVNAWSPEGIIEGFEKNRVIAVQWHPERLLDHPEQIRIAEAFLEMCRSAQQTVE